MRDHDLRSCGLQTLAERLVLGHGHPAVTAGKAPHLLFPIGIGKKTDIQNGCGILRRAMLEAKGKKHHGENLTWLSSAHHPPAALPCAHSPRPLSCRGPDAAPLVAPAAAR